MRVLRSSSDGEGGAVAAVEAVLDPCLFLPVGRLGLLRSVALRRRSTEVVLALPSSGHPDRGALAEAVAAALTIAGAAPPEVSFAAMDESEEQAFAEALRQTPVTDRHSRTRILAIGSGKGGVGKSSVTVNLAVALSSLGHSVGLLDADVYGFSVPSMLGIDKKPAMVAERLVPPVAFGVRCISMGFFVPEDQAVIWRGPMLHKALEQFLSDVHWGEPDFLLIDLPPGTGDVALSVSQFVPRAELFIVTTPQPAAERVAQRSAALARQLRMPVRGVVENMSFFTGDDGSRYELFGSGGGQALADSLGVPLLARLPLVPALREGGDTGRPVTADAPESDAAASFLELAGTIGAMVPSKVYRSELSVN